MWVSYSGNCCFAEGGTPADDLTLLQPAEKATPSKRNSRPSADRTDCTKTGYQPEFSIHVVSPALLHLPLCLPLVALEEQQWTCILHATDSGLQQLLLNSQHRQMQTQLDSVQQLFFLHTADSFNSAPSLPFGTLYLVGATPRHRQATSGRQSIGLHSWTPA